MPALTRSANRRDIIAFTNEGKWSVTDLRAVTLPFVRGEKRAPHHAFAVQWRLMMKTSRVEQHAHQSLSWCVCRQKSLHLSLSRDQCSLILSQNGAQLYIVTGNKATSVEIGLPLFKDDIYVLIQSRSKDHPKRSSELLHHLMGHLTLHIII